VSLVVGLFTSIASFGLSGNAHGVRRDERRAEAQDLFARRRPDIERRHDSTKTARCRDRLQH
jgi:hypothetical protein